MSHYSHFTTEERELSRVLKAQGLNYTQIAERLGKDKSSVSREFARNSREDSTYSANYADKQYAERRKNCGRKPILENEQAKNYVIEKLEQRWTPEQIARRAKLEKQPFVFSYPTIYRAIDSGRLPKQLEKIMRFKCKHKKCKGEDRRGKIPDTVSIHERPAGAENRSHFGHWESDTVLGKRGTGCIATHVERKSGYLVAVKIPDRQDKAFTVATIAAFAKISEKLKKSFTVDNGKEFAAHKELAAGTGMKVFFCDPYSPWQRGTNENTNSLIIQFFPNGTSFDDFSDEQLQAVVDLINKCDFVNIT